MNFSLTLKTFILIFFIVGCSERIKVKTSQIATSIPNPPSLVTITSIPSDLTQSPVFTITGDQSTLEFEIKILRSSDDSLITDWTKISNGGSVTGISLTEGTSYYAKIRAVNPLGPSSEITTDHWLPNTDLCLASMITNSPYAEGDGGQLSPYLICTEAQFLQMVTDTAHYESHFKLLTDIDLAGVSSFDGIGPSATPFKGYFNGNGKVISNMSITRLSGNSAGLFNEIAGATITDLTFNNAAIAAPASSSVGLVAGYCEDSHIKNITIINGTLSGQYSTGLVAGETYYCKISDAVISGTLTGQDEIGGLVGTTYFSTYLNINANITINSPSSYYVGGLTGVTYDESRFQNIHVTGTLIGDEYIGGLVGSDSGGSALYRSSFNGTVTGTGGYIGGVFGENYEVCDVGSVSSEFTLQGNYNIGGLSGSFSAFCDFKDILLKGTIATTGSSASDIGGMFGYFHTNHNSSLVNSFSQVDILSDATNVGGLIGNGHRNLADTNSSPFDIADNVVISNVTGEDPFNGISLFIGVADPYLLNGSSYYWSMGNCTNNATGVCNSTEGTPVAAVSDFYSNAVPPLANWDFLKIWELNPSAAPTLRQEQLITPVETTSCKNHALVDLFYSCPITVTDTDPHEFHLVDLQPEHTCKWMRDNFNTMDGIPVSADVGPCVLSYKITDGTNTTSSASSFSVKVHDDLSITGASLYDSHYYFTSPGGLTTITLLTVSNNSSVTLTGMTTLGLTSGSFSRTGGSCGSTLSPASSCTIIISFQSVVTTFTYDELILSYNNGSEAIEISYPVKGQRI